VRFHFNGQVAAGVIFGLLGIFFTLQNFSVLSLGDAQLFWPMLVVAVGLWEMALSQGIRRDCLPLGCGCR
jgi:hypothetical protein